VIRLLFLIVPVVVSGFIFFDAKKAIHPFYAFLIACATTFSFPWGPLLYLNFRKRLLLRAASSVGVLCSKCGHSPRYKIAKCPKCGNSLTM
jgi:hypothetical protein